MRKTLILLIVPLKLDWMLLNIFLVSEKTHNKQSFTQNYIKYTSKNWLTPEIGPSAPHGPPYTKNINTLNNQ